MAGQGARVDAGTAGAGGWLGQRVQADGRGRGAGGKSGLGARAESQADPAPELRLVGILSGKKLCY